MDLNTKRLILSNELMDLVNEINLLNNQWLDGLSMKQYNVYASFHLRLGCLTASQVSQVTRSNKLKTVAFKAYTLQSRAFTVNAELDSVLDSMERQWQLVGA